VGSDAGYLIEHIISVDKQQYNPQKLLSLI
jgi:hypothetical protein